MIIAYRMGGEDIDDQAKLPRIPESLVASDTLRSQVKNACTPRAGFRVRDAMLCLRSRNAATA